MSDPARSVGGAGESRRKPAVAMFVLNDCRMDTRVLREAGTLAAAGYPVTILARTTQPYAQHVEREQRDGFTIVRVPVASGLTRLLLLARQGGSFLAGARALRDAAGTRAGGVATLVTVALLAILALPLLLLAGLGAIAGRALLARFGPLGTAWAILTWRLQWRFAVLSWAHAAAALAPRAAILHAHDLRALPAALAARERSGHGAVIYDSHEVFVEAGANATRPARAKRAMRQLERRLAQRAQALVTVNDALASLLGPELGLERVVVVYNCPPRWDPPQPPPDLLRDVVGVPAGTSVILYHGALAPGRGAEQLIAALREPGLETAHLALLGFGPSRDELARRAADPDLGGRCHLLAPVAPDELLPWVASADVAAMPIQPTTLNHRLSTPNKLFEALAVGVPVVASDFPTMREIVAEDPTAPLGALCEPTSVEDVARALREVLDRPAAERAALRARCLAAAHRRWNWEIESAKLLALYEELGRGEVVAERTSRTAPQPQRLTIVLPSSGEHDSRAQRIAKDLARRGHRVTVIARAAPGQPPEEDWAAGAHVVRVDSGAALAPPDRGASGVRSLISEMRRIVATARRARRQVAAALAVDESAELYHAMGFLALPVALRLATRAQAPLVYDARDIYAESGNVARLPRAVRAIFRLRERRWAQRAARVMTVNGACADYLARSLNVARPAVVMNAQPAWTPPDTPPDLIRQHLGLPAGTPIVLYHGGFMRDRGLPELAAAMRLPGLEEAHLVLLGSGVLEQELRTQAAEPAAGGRTHLLPPVPPAELLPWVASADVGVMPNQPRTLNERLSTPNKLFECLAAGLPVVSSDFPERRRIIVDDPDGPLGAVCDPTDIQALATAIRSILELDPAARAELRARILRAAHDRYAWDRQLAVLLVEYAALTSRPW